MTEAIVQAGATLPTGRADGLCARARWVGIPRDPRFHGSVVAIEVKAAAEVTAADVRHFLWLRREIGDAVRDLVIVTTGTHAYRRADGVAVVPAVLPGP